MLATWASIIKKAVSLALAIETMAVLNIHFANIPKYFKLKNIIYFQITFSCFFDQFFPKKSQTS